MPTVRVMMVEDNDDFVHIIKGFLEESGEGWQVEVSARLGEAEQRLEKERYDLILLDLALPDSKGLQTFLRLRKKAPGTAIVILTGLNDETIALEAMKEGAQDYIIKGDLTLAILKRIVLFALERQKILEKWEVAWKEEKDLATQDPLTQLPNRLLLKDRLRQSLSLARRQRQTVAALFVDLDRFKEINDTLGHEAGDLVLKEVAERLRVSVRQEDTVARVGGDEFIVLLYGPKTETDAAQVATRILRKIDEPYLISEKRLRVTASIGIALFPQSAEESQELLRNADLAMYLAKNDGGNRHLFYSRTHDKGVKSFVD
ncbi:MAG: GGDEF domain-containing response regulator [Deltaproteobacteria bacterium]|nr:GGDEF domain-containing response regulator [Deltaproteobacteria bacterium]MBI4374525.1 GGDEF domain-containing response regulator [Deltaproteobacteria bacterium]